MIDFVTVVADERKDTASRCRLYPYLSEQIFSLEIEQIITKFFQAPSKPSEEDKLLILDDLDNEVASKEEVEEALDIEKEEKVEGQE